MTVRLEVISEPLLEFGRGRTGVTPRSDLRESGPFGAIEGETKVIELGLVCLETEIPAVRAWFDRMSRLLVGEEANARRFPEFPGSQKAFASRFDISERFIKGITTSQYAKEAAKRPIDRFEGMLGLFAGRIQALLGDVRPHVIVVCLPDEEAELRVINPKLDPKDRELLDQLQKRDDAQQSLFAPDPEELAKIAELRPQAEELLYRNFYRALKAKCMGLHNAIPLQVLRQHTYMEEKAQQSAATRAWNLGVSLYYKAGNVPWRPFGLSDDYCFVGISFHHLKRRDGDIVYASVAQAFSNSVEPFILKGEFVPPSQVRNHQPYMTRDQAAQLIGRVIEGYQSRADMKPSRVVVHKTSRYQSEECEGFRDGLQSVPAGDLVWLGQTGLRLVKRGSNEVWRGTLVHVGDREHYLFTTGFVPWWQEYPGPHIPSPVQLGAAFETDIRERAREILLLTKMNWNSSDGVSRFPVTLSFARRVGTIMTELPEDAVPNPSYRFYM